MSKTMRPETMARDFYSTAAEAQVFVAGWYNAEDDAEHGQFWYAPETDRALFGDTYRAEALWAKQAYDHGRTAWRDANPWGGDDED